ncbi:MAG: ribonuclease P protein component [Planctomycetota bacterium]
MGQDNAARIPADRLRVRADFDRVFRQGRVWRGPRLSVHIAPSREARARLGIVVSRKVGGAVTRNRFKRLLREAFRREKPLLPLPCDVVVVVRSSVDDGMEPLAAELRRAFQSFPLTNNGSA